MIERDFVGYGPTPPNPKWPNNSRLALNIVINYEEGSEESFSDGDEHSEIGLTEVPNISFSGRDLGAESMFEYGSRVGIWRIFRILQERNLPATVFACAQALERNLLVAKTIREYKYDVCSHGLRWIRPQNLTANEESRHIALAVESIKKTTGFTPVGWYSRYAPTINTRRLLLEHGGFLYDSDSYNDELPYWVQTPKNDPYLVIPYTQTHNDGKFVRSGIATGDDFFYFLRDSFDMLYAEGSTHPKMMSVGLHMRLVGHPGRAMGFAKFLDYVVKHRDVWICKRIDIARHWHQHHYPFPFKRS